MMESMGALRRTHYTSQITPALAGETMVVAGSIAKSRNLGGMVFADLRDSDGIVQLAFGNTTEASVFEKATKLHSEYIVVAKGTLRLRENPNKQIFTGQVELDVQDLRILSDAQTPPFEIRDEVNVNEELRLRYRYLDLRRDTLHKTIVMRSRVATAVRNYYMNNHFVDIETPIMVRSTPEGARDYLVPSRVQPGRFFALPQSPQLYKQLLMLSGFDRYFQMARCFRDEDLRADRQPEFTQVDIEMAFVDVDDVLTLNEKMVQEVFKDILEVDVPTPFLRMPYTEAMERFGSDKPDTRFGLELCNISSIVKDSGFGVFDNALAAGGSVRLINAKGLASVLSRKEIDRLTLTAKTYGAKGLAFLRLTDESSPSSYEKFLSEEMATAVRTAASAEIGDALLLVADPNNDVVFAALGALRQEIAKKQGLVPKGMYNFLWVTDFPLFDHNAETNQFSAKHHPFTMPKDEDIQFLESNPALCRAKAYDMVLNGVELGGGSIRISNPTLQAQMFKILGFTPERARDSFGFLMDAYQYGAPPHGGMAFGFDRLLMLMLDVDSIRDVIAFPKVQNSSELMTGSPHFVDDAQLKDLRISSTFPLADKEKSGE